MMEKYHPELRLAAKALASKQQQQKEQETLDAIDIVDPSVSLSSPTALRALRFQEVKKLLAEEHSLSAVSRMLNISRQSVTKYQYYSHYPVRSCPKRQQSTVLPYKEYLAKRWNQGERNLKQLWREIKQQGYSGSANSVYSFFKHIPQYIETLPLQELEVKNWTATKVQFLLSKKEVDLTEEEQDFLTIFFQHCPQAKLARELALNFRIIFENKDTKALPDWIQQAKSSGIAALKNFAIGLESDYAAVEAAAAFHWSNGQVEGQVNRLKLIKKQMYGRAGFDLLQKRVVHYTNSS